MKRAFAVLLLVFCAGCATQPNLGPEESRSVSPLEKWRAQNDEFMTQVSVTEGVSCTDSGLCYKMIRHGQSAPPDDNDVVVLSYRQTLIDGSLVESFDSDSPAQFPAGNVIKGFVEALKLMKAPARAQFYIPAALAFADRGAGTRVPPWSVLIIDAQLIRVIRKD